MGIGIRADYSTVRGRKNLEGWRDSAKVLAIWSEAQAYEP